MRLDIANRTELRQWFGERRKLAHDVRAIKWPPPEGATYEDGELIIGLVNVAWLDIVSGEVFQIEYIGAPK
jgi:hypothetical protein